MKRKFVYLTATVLLLLCAALAAAKGTQMLNLAAAEEQNQGGEEEAVTASSAGLHSDAERPGTWDAADEQSKYKDGLPVVRITMENGAEPLLRTPLWAEAAFYDNQGDPYPDTIDAQVWIRGQSSARYSKKQYGIDVLDGAKSSKSKDVSVFGMKEDSDWVLNGPYYDRSLIRNALMYGISREIFPWAPDTRFCEAWVNGVYQGLYVMIETVKVSPSRLDLYDYGFATGETAYLTLRDRATKDMSRIDPFGTQSGRVSGTVYVKFPKEDKLSDRQLEWIEDDLSRFERLLYMDAKEPAYLDMIDLDSFVDYYIINEFSMNRDAGSYSTYCYKDMKGRLSMGPVWDFNNTFNNYVEFLYTDSFIVSANNWFRELMEDRVFVDAVVSRYRELRRGILSEEELYQRIDTYVEILGDAPARDRQRWEESLYYSKDPRHTGTYEDAVAFLKTCIHDRGVWMDENIEQLYQYCR